MPYKIFKQNDKWCVFKLVNDKKSGSSLGCHSAKEKAEKQIIAIQVSEEERSIKTVVERDFIVNMPPKKRYSATLERREERMNTDEQARSLFDNFWQGLRNLFTENNTERAMNLGDIDNQAWQAADIKYPMAFFHSTFRDDDGTIFAVLSQDGKLYTSEVTITDDGVELEEWVQAKQEFTPVQTRTIIRQQEDGRYRWISRSASAAVNRVNEIDSTKLFDSFVDHIDRTGKYPIRQFMHQGQQFKTGQADFVARDDYILITSGLFDDTDIAQVEIKARQNNPDYWGESIGYKPLDGESVSLEGGVTIPVFTRGILEEISTTPEWMATNLFTSTEVQQRMLKGKVKNAFVKLFTDAGLEEVEADKWLEENVDEVNRQIEEAGLITRSDSEEEGEEQATEPEAQEETTEQDEDMEIDDTVVEAVVARMQEVENEEIVKLRSLVEEMTTSNQELTDALTSVSEALEDIGKRLEVLEEDDDQKRQRYQEDLPESRKVRVSYKPRQSENGDLEKSYTELSKERMPKGAY